MQRSSVSPVPPAPRLSTLTANRGTENYVMFMERFAVVGASGTRHTWPSLGERGNYLYSPEEANDPAKIELPQFNTAPVDACNGVPHAFTGKVLQVGLADGSARTICLDVTRTFTYGDGQSSTVWAWACSYDGPLENTPVPDGW